MDHLVTLRPRANQRRAEHDVGRVEGERLVAARQGLSLGHHLGLSS